MPDPHGVKKKKNGRYTLESVIFNEVSLSGICEMSVSYTLDSKPQNKATETGHFCLKTGSV